MSNKTHFGYLMVDHRASPGLPEDVARKMGYDITLTQEGKLFEADTLMCAHCPQVWFKNPLRDRARGHCFKCNSYVCDICELNMRAADYVHKPRQKEIDDFVDNAAKSTPSTLPIFTPAESGNLYLPQMTKKDDTNG